MICSQALTWEGTKFRHQGRTKGVSTDCAGLIIGIARELGLDTFVNFKDYRDYHRVPNGDKMTHVLNKFMTKVRNPEPGDILHMRFFGNPQHLAILLEGNNVIHANSNFGKVVVHRLDSEWKSYVIGSYRYRGIN